ncbi:MAG: hypothetical protein ACE5HH_00855 [Candidatus Hydrothermarchaeales archaeon]
MMAEAPEQIEISGRMIASPRKTEARFEKKDIKLTASPSNPLVLVFSADYRWEEQGDTKLNDWDFYMTITDEKGKDIYSDYKHFGEDEPSFVEKDELAYLEYLKDEDNYQSGDGTMVRSLKTPTTQGTHTYTCQLRAQFWARKLGEEKDLEKNKTESTDECTVTVTVK